MPAMSCRDVDEICDWFWRDEDAGRLVLNDIIHTEEQHTQWMENYMADVKAGKKHLADMIEAMIAQMRWP